MVDFCPWTPVNLEELLQNTVSLPYSIQEGLLKKRLCKAENDDEEEEEEDPLCEIPLRDLIDQFLTVEMSAATLNAFEEYVFDRYVGV